MAAILWRLCSSPGWFSKFQGSNRTCWTVRTEQLRCKFWFWQTRGAEHWLLRIFENMLKNILRTLRSQRCHLTRLKIRQLCGVPTQPLQNSQVTKDHHFVRSKAPSNHHSINIVNNSQHSCHHRITTTSFRVWVKSTSTSEFNPSGLKAMLLSGHLAPSFWA